MLKKLRITALVVFLLVFTISAFKLLDYYGARKQDREAFQELAQVVAQGTEAASATEAQAEVLQVLPGLAQLYARNADLFGWLKIEGTVIDYPVMYTPNDPQCYLYRAFDGSYSDSGVPFLDGACFSGCGNYLLHGHHMQDGSMFASLLKYENREYWQDHPVIRFDTLYESGEFEVVAAFYSKLYEKNEEGFRYYEYTDLREETDFAEYIRSVKALALYDTGVEAEFGDQLITLATCAYHTANGRFVVVARKAATE